MTLWTNLVRTHVDLSPKICITKSLYLFTMSHKIAATIMQTAYSFGSTRVYQLHNRAIISLT